MMSWKWLRELTDGMTRLFEPKSEYGLTEQETEDLVALARGSQHDYDIAEECAVSGHGLSFRKFDALMAERGLRKPRWDAI